MPEKWTSSSVGCQPAVSIENVGSLKIFCFKCHPFSTFLFYYWFLKIIWSCCILWVGRFFLAPAWYQHTVLVVLPLLEILSQCEPARLQRYALCVFTPISSSQMLSNNRITENGPKFLSTDQKQVQVMNHNYSYIYMSWIMWMIKNFQFWVHSHKN